MLGAYDRDRQLAPILLRNSQEGITVDPDLLPELELISPG